VALHGNELDVAERPVNERGVMSAEGRAIHDQSGAAELESRENTHDPRPSSRPLSDLDPLGAPAGLPCVPRPTIGRLEDSRGQSPVSPVYFRSRPERWVALDLPFSSFSSPPASLYPNWLPQLAAVPTGAFPTSFPTSTKAQLSPRTMSGRG
jgi:hypothetical protein